MRYIYTTEHFYAFEEELGNNVADVLETVVWREVDRAFPSRSRPTLDIRRAEEQDTKQIRWGKLWRT